MKYHFARAFRGLRVILCFSGLAGFQMPGNGRFGIASIAEAAGAL
jgi:hypothetical protein